VEMKTLIAIADTHIEHQPLKEALPTSLLKLIEDADLLIHAGSFTTTSAYQEFSEIANLKAVWGTKDCNELKQTLPKQLKLTIENVKIGVIHRGAHVTNTQNMRYLAKQMEVDVLIYGYLHKTLIDKSDVLTICPGSPTLPRMSLPSAVQLTIDKKEVNFKVIICSGQICNYLKFTDKLNREHRENKQSEQ
jgi:hypothetical protein